MKTLIVSDIHLRDVFDKKKYLYLEHLFSSVDHIILNGDFWDGYCTTFDRFISSQWNQLFPLLRSKGAIYIYGNHDQKQFSDERTSLFSVEQKDNYILKIDSITYYIEHGDMLCPSIDTIFHLSRKFLNNINVCLQYMEYMSTLIGSPHNILLKLANKKIKNKLKIKQFSHWYVCGHTHLAELDEMNRFANSGYIQHGVSSYLIADSSGLSLRTDCY